MKTLSASFSVPYQFPVYFVDNIFAQLEVFNTIFSDHTDAPLILPVIEQEVVNKFPSLLTELQTLLEQFGAKNIPSLVMFGGEQGKNTPETVLKIIDECIEQQIDRHSYILAIGGGAFIDMVGYAAAITHRGVRLIRMPTTVLGQNDAGIGVKNAINYRGRKNFLGTFAVPCAVINDYRFILSLEERDKRAGIAEAIKVALIKDKAFFYALSDNKTALKNFEMKAMKDMIVRCADLHLQHICNNGDPFERGSTRPLDFGHWSAHALEESSNFRLRHGEAVAIGILLDSKYSFYQNWISAEEFTIIENLITTLGFDIDYISLSKLDVSLSLDNFRAHLGGELCITMLSSIGKCHEVNNIDMQLMQNSVDYLLGRT
jgi:3-dehydroquinate synthase